MGTHPRISTWRHLSQVEKEAVAGEAYRNEGDILLIVKDRMASRQILQVSCLVGGADLATLYALPEQPSGVHERRPASMSDRRKVRDSAMAAHAAGVISVRARDYLVQWAEGTRRRLPRPARYHFLSWRAGRGPHPSMSTLALDVGGRVRRPPRCVEIAGRGGSRAAVGQRDFEEEGEAAEGPLVIAAE